MPPVGFEPTISAGEQPLTHVLHRSPTGTYKARIPSDTYTCSEDVLPCLEQCT